MVRSEQMYQVGKQNRTKSFDRSNEGGKGQKRPPFPGPHPKIVRKKAEPRDHKWDGDRMHSKRSRWVWGPLMPIE